MLQRRLIASVFPPLLFVASACDGFARSETGPWGGEVLETPIERPDFVLTDTRGERFDFRAETEGLTTLLFIGYTHCPDVCPVHFANLAAVLERQSYELRSRVRVVFVTADPDRDSPDRIRRWLDRVNSEFIGLRGDRSDVHAIEDQLGVPRSSLGEDDGTGSYLVAHAAQIFAFGPDGPARLVYPFGTRQTDWVRDLPKLVEGVMPHAAGAG